MRATAACGRQEFRHAQGTDALGAVAQEIGFQTPLQQKGRVRIEHAAQYGEIRAQRADQAVVGDGGATHHIAMAGDELGQAVEKYIDIVLTVLVYTGEGIVEQGQRAVGARQARERGDVGDLVDRVGGTLEDHQACGARGQLALNAGKILDRQHTVGNAKFRQRAQHQMARRSIGLDEAQHMIALRA